MKLYKEVYHGTASRFDSIDVFVNVADGDLELGFGFYTSLNIIVAKEYAIMRSEEKGESARIYVYNFDEETAKSKLKFIEFKEPSYEWYQFIVENEVGGVQFDNLDIVIAPLMSPEIWQIYKSLDKGEILHNDAKVLISQMPYDMQVVFKSPESVKYLEKIDELEIDNE